MNDREMLEFAARAAGLPPAGMEGGEGGPMSKGGLVWSGAGECIDWNPLADDGDALRLAVKLNMEIQFMPDAVRCRIAGGQWIGETCLPCDTEYLGKAERRAITRTAAAEIARFPIGSVVRR